MRKRLFERSVNVQSLGDEGYMGKMGYGDRSSAIFVSYGGKIKGFANKEGMLPRSCFAIAP